MHQHSKNPKNIASSLGCASMRQSGLAKMVGFGAILAVLSLNPSLHAGVVGLWCFDEGTGTTTQDLSGNSLTGTLSSTTNWTANHPAGATYDYAGNHAVAFDKNNLQQVTIGNSSSLNAAAVSIQFWYKDSSEASVGDPNYSYIGARAGSWFIERYRADANSPICLRLYLKRSDATGEWYTSTYNITRDLYVGQDGKWHNIAFTCTADGIFSSYRDGVLYGSTNYNKTLATDGTSAVTLGVYTYSSARRNSFAMDEFVIYNEAITAGQVLANYQTSLVPEPASLALLAVGGLLVCRRKRG